MTETRVPMTTVGVSGVVPTHEGQRSHRTALCGYSGVWEEDKGQGRRANIQEMALCFVSLWGKKRKHAVEIEGN